MPFGCIVTLSGSTKGRGVGALENLHPLRYDNHVLQLCRFFFPGYTVCLCGTESREMFPGSLCTASQTEACASAAEDVMLLYAMLC